MSYKIESGDLNADGWPVDWLSDVTAKGLSKASTNQRYHVRLTVTGKQFFITTASTQAKGARLYDLALWKLAGFLPRIHPNYPDDFAAITQALVDEECPNLNTLYSQVESAILPQDDLTERERREAAIERTVQSKTVFTSNKPTSTAYTKYQKQVHKLRVQLIMSVPRLMAERLALNFVKFPELHQLAAECEAKLQAAEESLRVLQPLLTNHVEIYAKLT